MDGEKRRKIQKFISVISLILVAVIAVFLFVASTNQKLTGTVFHIIIGGFLTFYWILFDVIEPILLKQFDHLTRERKIAYIKYVLIDAVGYGGIAYFVCLLGGSSSNKGIVGAVIYVVCISLKRRFKEEFTAEEPPKETEKKQREKETKPQ